MLSCRLALASAAQWKKVEEGLGKYKAQIKERVDRLMPNLAGADTALTTAQHHLADADTRLAAAMDESDTWMRLCHKQEGKDPSDPEVIMMRYVPSRGRSLRPHSFSLSPDQGW